MPPGKPTDKRVKTTPKKRLTFSTRVGSARAVHITGDFTQWSKDGIPLMKGAEGEWSTTLELLPGDYQYRLLVDGRWEDDPHAQKSVVNPFGSRNGVLSVS